MDFHNLESFLNLPPQRPFLIAIWAKVHSPPFLVSFFLRFWISSLKLLCHPPHLELQCLLLSLFCGVSLFPFLFWLCWCPSLGLFSSWCECSGRATIMLSRTLFFFFLICNVFLFFFIIAGFECSVNFLLYNMVTQLHIHA